MFYRLKRKCYPYVPSIEGYGPGCATPWPKISMLDVGYQRHPQYPGNVVGKADGGVWEIITVWQSRWMAIKQVITGTIIFSVPPGTLEPIETP